MFKWIFQWIKSLKNYVSKAEEITVTELKCIMEQVYKQWMEVANGSGICKMKYNDSCLQSFGRSQRHSFVISPE